MEDEQVPGQQAPGHHIGSLARMRRLRVSPQNCSRISASMARPTCVGLRWQASKETPINLRIDYAVGKDSQALYVSVGEAF